MAHPLSTTKRLPVPVPVYLAPELHATWTPIDHHERSREGSDNPAWDEHGAMAGAHGYPEPFFPGARRLDGGGRANPTIMPMVREASNPYLIQSLSNPIPI